MEPAEFRNYLENNSAVFEKWGQYVADTVISSLETDIGKIPFPSFLKIEPVPRVKTIDSAMGKIGRKKYDNPLAQMTDLVGVRFVVLLSEDIDLLSDIIRREESWNVVVSKDVQDEIDKNPKIFDYQSLHFEVRPKGDLDLNGTTVSSDVCCEVQIRTLLQHAYAELVHDNIYKPVGTVPSKAERQVAKSMALMETTDELFCSSMRLLTEANQPRKDLLTDLSKLYRDKVAGHLMKIDEKINFLVLDEFKDQVEEGVSPQIFELINDKKYIPLKIAARAESSYFFSQPVSLFVYWLVASIGPDSVVSKWPLPGYLRELDSIFSDLDMVPTHH